MNEENNIDYFLGRLDNSIAGSNIDEIASSLKDQETTLNSRTATWNNEAVKKYFTDSFGDEALTKFNQAYDGVQKEYNAVEYAKLDGKQTEITEKTYIDPFLKKAYNQSINLRTVTADDTGRYELIGKGTVSERTKSPRKAALDSGLWTDKNGVEHKLSAPGMYQWLVNNDRVTDEEGNKIKGFVYPKFNELEDSDGMIRKPIAIRAIYEGQEPGDNEFVSDMDNPITGLYSPQLEGNIFSSVHRAVNGTVSNLLSGMLNQALSAGDLAKSQILKGYEGNAEMQAEINKRINSGFSGTVHKFLERQIAQAKSAKVSISDESQSSFNTSENWSTLIVDVAIQLATARALATGGMNLASAAGASAETTKLVTKLSSTVPLTLMAVADSRDDAIAAGYTPEQAAYYNFAMVGAMFGVNQAFSWVDKGLDANKLMTEAKAINKAYIEEAMAAAKAQYGNNIPNEVVDNISKKAATGFGKVISGGVKGLNDAGRWLTKGGTWNDMAQESLEETSETIGEYLVKGGFNTITGEDKFMTTKDPEYWKRFWTETGMSALGGAIGGGMMKAGQKIFKSMSTTPEERTQIVDFILKGEDKEYGKALEEQYKSGALGRFDLSTVYDEKTNSFLSVKEAADSGKNPISQADANLKMLQNKYNSIKTMVQFMGVENIYKNISENPAYGDNDLSYNVSKKATGLTQEYLDIVLKNNLTDIVPAVSQVVRRSDIPELAKKITEDFKIANPVVEGEEVKTIDTAIVERLLEIRAELEEIKTGEAEENFILEKISNNKITSSDDKDFFSKLNKLSFNNVNEYETRSTGLAKQLAENKELINSIGNSMQDFQEKFLKLHQTETGHFILDDQANKLVQQKLEELLNSDPTVVQNLSKISDFITKEVAKKNIEELENNIDYEALDDVQQENVLKIINSYYNYLTENLNGAKAASLRILDTEGLIKLADEHVSMSFETDDATINSIINESLNDDGLFTPISQVPEFSSEMQDLDAISQIYKTIFGITQLKHNFEKKIIKESNGVIEPTLQQENLSTYDYWNALFKDNQLESFLRGFNVAEDKSYKDAGALIDNIDSITKVFDSMTVNGVNRFNNLDEVLALKKQIQARLDQVDSLIKGIPAMVDYRARLLKINNISTEEDNIKKVFEELVDNDRNELYSKMKEWGLDPDLISFAMYKAQKQSANLEDKEQLEKLHDTERKLQAVLNTLSNYAAKVQKMVLVAEKNQENITKLEQEQNYYTKSLKDQLSILENLFAETGKLLEGKENFQELKDELKKHTENNIGKDASSISKDKSMLYKINKFLLSLDRTEKTNLMGEIFRIYEGNSVSELSTTRSKPTGSRTKLLQASLPMYIDIQDVTNRILKIENEDDFKNNVIISEQELVVQSIVAHVTSEFSRDFHLHMKSTPRANKELPSHLQDVMIVPGFAGTGKTTYCAGFGAKVAQDILFDKLNSDSKKKAKVLLCSADQHKINSLKATAKKHKISTSFSEQGGLDFEKLAALKDDDFELNTNALIIIDEATLAKYTESEEGTLDKPALLSIILNKVEKINKKRVPPIKVLLMGDNSQNGYYEVNTDGSLNTFNISDEVQDFISGPDKLSTSFRAKVTEITSFAAALKGNAFTKKFGNIKTSYGLFQNDSEKKFAGVHCGTNSNMNDPKFIQHLEDMIKQRDKNEEPFQIGIISDVELSSELPIMQLATKYQENFLIRTHQKAQGNEVDYAIVLLNESTFNHEPELLGKELTLRKKLATSVERARYFALVVDETDRGFSSSIKNDFAIPDAVFNEYIIENLKKFRRESTPNKEHKPSYEKGKIVEKKTPLQETKTNWLSKIQSVNDEDSLNELQDELIINNENTPELTDEIAKKRALLQESKTVEEAQEEVPSNIITEEKITELQDSQKELTTKQQEEITEKTESIALQEETIKDAGNEELLEKTDEELKALKKSVNTEYSVEEIEEVQDIKQKAEFRPEFTQEIELPEEELETFEQRTALDTARTDATSVQREFNQKGWLNCYIKAYQNEKNKDHFKYVSTLKDAPEFSGIKFVENESRYNDQQLKAIGHKALELDEDFNYFIHIFRTLEDAKNVFEIIATNKQGESVIVAQVFIGGAMKDLPGVSGEKTGMRSFLDYIDNKVQKDRSTLIPADKEDLFDKEYFRISSGGIEANGINTDGSRAKFDYTEQKALLESQGAKFSEGYFIYTGKDSGKGGNVFTIYSMNQNQDLSEEAMTKLVTNLPPVYTDSPFRNLKNGLGMLMLDIRGLTWEELHKIHSSNTEQEIFQFTAKNGDANRVMAFFAALTTAINNAKTGSMLPNEYSALQSFVERYNENKRSGATIGDKVSKLLNKGKNDVLELQKLTDEIFSDIENTNDRKLAIEKFYSLILNSLTNSALGERIDSEGRTVYVNDFNNFLFYNPNVEGRAKKDLIQFSKRIFDVFSEVDDDKALGRALKFFDAAQEIMSGKKETIGITPVAATGGFANKLFAYMKANDVIESKLQTTATNITFPQVRIKSDFLQELIDKGLKTTTSEKTDNTQIGPLSITKIPTDIDKSINDVEKKLNQETKLNSEDKQAIEGLLTTNKLRLESLLKEANVKLAPRINDKITKIDELLERLDNTEESSVIFNTLSPETTAAIKEEIMSNPEIANENLSKLLDSTTSVVRNLLSLNQVKPLSKEQMIELLLSEKQMIAENKTLESVLELARRSGNENLINTVSTHLNSLEELKQASFNVAQRPEVLPGTSSELESELVRLFTGNEEYVKLMNGEKFNFLLLNSKAKTSKLKSEIIEYIQKVEERKTSCKVPNK